MEISGKIGEISETLEYATEEKEALINHFMNLTTLTIHEFLESKDIKKNGTKSQLRKRIIENIRDEKIQYEDLKEYLDYNEQYGKQHVVLFDSPEDMAEDYSKSDYFTELIEENGLKDYLNKSLPILAHQDLSLSSIEFQASKYITVFSLESQNHFIRNEKLDEINIIDEDEVERRAYIRKRKRGMVIFRWDLELNTASLHITQLPSRDSYKKKEKTFSKDIRKWLNLSSFDRIDLKPIIKKLHENEETESAETRSHSLGYKTIGGRKLLAQSSTYQESVLGEDTLDKAISEIRDTSVGHSGNFYWIPTENELNPLEKEIHTSIIGKDNRINFTSPTKEGDLKYVLSRVRELSD